MVNCPEAQAEGWMLDIEGWRVYNEESLVLRVRTYWVDRALHFSVHVYIWGNNYDREMEVVSWPSPPVNS